VAVVSTFGGGRPGWLGGLDRVRKAAFDEFRIGLDHLEFLVAHRDDLDTWVTRLDELGIRHSGVKEPLLHLQRHGHLPRSRQHPA
jgi:hypothetical protein